MWKLIDGSFVTGHISRKGQFVDLRPGFIHFNVDDNDCVTVVIKPCKGVIEEPLYLPATITQVVTQSRFFNRVAMISVVYDGQKIYISVPPHECLFVSITK